MMELSAPMICAMQRWIVNMRPTIQTAMTVTPARQIPAAYLPDALLFKLFAAMATCAQQIPVLREPAYSLLWFVTMEICVRLTPASAEFVPSLP